MRKELLLSLLFSGCFNPICGDGFLQDREECDQGNTINGDGCDENCQFERPVVCGDDIRVSPEQCDDGNTINGDGCDELCQDEFCGDGIDNNRTLEQCDDGNTINGDGCDNNCTTTKCGNSIASTDEQCDDANINDNDGCTNQCKLATCGDNIIQSLIETCDDGNQNNDDTCPATCQQNQCGDGSLHPDEQCDDGNQTSGDGCSSTCTIETTTCGDGVVAPPEECDDANNSDDDSCLSSCQLARCGDSHAQLGAEQCDDANLNDHDNCQSNCTRPLIQEIHAGEFFVCAVTTLGDIRCWGQGERGQLGNGSAFSIGDDEPASQNGNVLLNESVSALSVGAGHSCVLYPSFGGDAARCWGANANGQLGNSSNEDFGALPGEAPSLLTDIPGLPGVTQIVAGPTHTCAELGDTSLKCWGDNFFGALGYGDTIASDVPRAETIALDLNGATIKQLSLGLSSTCVLRSDGQIACWGLGESGELGYGEFVTLTQPNQQTIALGGAALQLSNGSVHTCALLDDSTIECWGGNFFGQLGLGTTQNTAQPGAAVDLSGTPIQVSAGRIHTCALFDDGSVACWGRAAEGQLGDGNTNNIGDDEPPSSAGELSLSGPATQLSALGDFSCALLQNGTVQCWGDNSFGQLGYGNTNNIGDDETPASVGPTPVF